MPGMYEVTSKPFVRRTRHTLRRAEFGFFGVVVYTRTQTPRFCGQRSSAGELVFQFLLSLPLRTNWLIVGIIQTSSSGISLACTRSKKSRQAIHTIAAST